jgi:ribonuclease HI
MCNRTLFTGVFPDKINDTKQALKHLQAFKKIVIFQWVPSHVGLVGNERVNKPKRVLLYILKKHPHKLTH